MKKINFNVSAILHIGVVVLIIITAPFVLLGFVGVFAGLLTDAPYATNSFKISIFFASCIASLGVFYGFKHKSTWWGKILGILAVWGFAFVGLIAFGPV
jgi:hypothetical protein